MNTPIVFQKIIVYMYFYNVPIGATGNLTQWIWNLKMMHPFPNGNGATVEVRNG